MNGNLKFTSDVSLLTTTAATITATAGFTLFDDHQAIIFNNNNTLKMTFAFQ